MPQAEKPDSTPTSRRRFLAATAATAAGAASGAATATALPALAMGATGGGENPAIIALGVAFERLLQKERDAWDAIPDDAPDSSWKPAALVQDEVHKVVEQIALLPALTTDGLRLKARAVAWCSGGCYGHGDNPVLYAQASSTLDERIAHSIIQDLMQRWSPPPDDDAAENNRTRRVTLMTPEDQKPRGSKMRSGTPLSPFALVISWWSSRTPMKAGTASNWPACSARIEREAARW